MLHVVGGLCSVLCKFWSLVGGLCSVLCKFWSPVGGLCSVLCKFWSPVGGLCRVLCKFWSPVGGLCSVLCKFWSPVVLRAMNWSAQTRDLKIAYRIWWVNICNIAMCKSNLIWYENWLWGWQDACEGHWNWLRVMSSVRLWCYQFKELLFTSIELYSFFCDVALTQLLNLQHFKGKK